MGKWFYHLHKNNIYIYNMIPLNKFPYILFMKIKNYNLLLQTTWCLILSLILLLIVFILFGENKEIIYANELYPDFLNKC